MLLGNDVCSKFKADINLTINSVRIAKGERIHTSKFANVADCKICDCTITKQDDKVRCAEEESVPPPCTAVVLLTPRNEICNSNRGLML